MLENGKFVDWANENIIVVVGHTEDKHPTEYEDEKGKMAPGCPLYRGLTCEQHRAITGECRNASDDLPKIGPVPGLAGLYVNTGHYRNGVNLAPGSARLVADLLLERDSIVAPEPFAPTRQ